MRASASVSLNCMFSIGEIILVCLVYYFRDWRSITRWIIAIPLLLSAIPFIYVYESPRFLYINKKKNELKQYLLRVRDINAQADNQLREKGRLIQNAEIADPVATVAQKVSFFSLFSDKRLRGNIFSLVCIFYYTYIVYNGLIFGLDNIGSDIYVNGLIVSASEVVGYLIAASLIKKTPRKTLLGVCLLVSSTLGLTYIFLGTKAHCPNGEEDCFKTYLESFLAMTIKLGSSIIMSVIFVYASELLPTRLRATGMGFCIFVGRLGSMLAPAIAQYSKVLGIHQMVVYGVVGFIALASLRFNEETLGKQMSDQKRHYCMDVFDRNPVRDDAKLVSVLLTSKSDSRRLRVYYIYLLSTVTLPVYLSLNVQISTPCLCIRKYCLI
eukprot:TRINITY_DN3271_c0_g1_i14.p1 TRINITY_DN3271_c0_g1~~TRINITY_DN3271_c0_g1_i14.p1  ORF type:complete len:382 (-),score=67.16 TRINITY_DN3271_c0_g1_i14:105-1250(-)